jgi:23S rRNA (cytosine1962-C5)-methyltransferase
MNGLSVHKEDYHDTDFFDEVAAQKSQGNLYDCVILDPPFFSTTQRGRVDLVGESQRLINKVRPLVKDGGWLVLINNALFVKGSDYLASLEALGRDGYLTVERLVPVPFDMTGTPETIVGYAPRDPSPYNHPTKITLLRVKRKA